MEKQLATPDAYPLTVNSLLAACNQKSNREPVTRYDKGEVVRILRELESRSFARYEMGARSERYEQRITHALGISKRQQALLTIMLLRGPQTANELLTRSQRLYEFSDNAEMQTTLDRLMQGDHPFVVCIPATGGQRGDRYGHLFSGMPEMPVTSHSTRSAADPAGLAELQAEVTMLRAQLERLYKLTGHSLEETSKD